MATRAILPLERAFAPIRDSGDGDVDAEYWFPQALSTHRSLRWSDILAKRLVVIVGEAGIGKTEEFRQRAAALRAAGTAAFFLPLNEIERPESVEQLLVDSVPAFASWLHGTQPGSFFVDAVDEARLTDSSRLQVALRSLRFALGASLSRSSIYISSRTTDWSLPAVRQCIEQLILEPLRSSEAEGLPAIGASDAGVVAGTLLREKNVELEAYALQPLSKDDAKRLAAHYGVDDVEAFWDHVEQGGYEYLATRPLDLDWLAGRWFRLHSLGSHSELIEDAVTNRLKEKNQSYIDAGAVLSPEQLRRGVECLAAAAVFSGQSQFQIAAGVASDGLVVPSDVLPNLSPLEHLRLLGTAIFDVATYGRAHFHHRSFREYLAACWVSHEIEQGLSVREAVSLFARAPFDRPVLINSRRAVLCWLASGEPKVRDWVVSEFPEMLMYEGDPERWSEGDVVRAFTGYLKKLKEGLRLNWYNDRSELRRVARRLPSSVALQALREHEGDRTIAPRLLNLIASGHLTSCSDAVFRMYRAASSSDWQRYQALHCLAEVGNTTQKGAVAKDLVAGKLQTNELLALGLNAIGWGYLSKKRLVGVFRQAHVEERHGGAMRTGIVEALPSMDRSGVTKVLEALLRSLSSDKLQRLLHQGYNDQVEGGWIFATLPDVLLRAIELLPSASAPYERSFVAAAVLVQQMRHTPYFNVDKLRSLRDAIARHPPLRKQVALEIAAGRSSKSPMWELTGLPGVVRYDAEDLPGLVSDSLNEALGVSERTIWYEVARDVGMLRLKGRERRSTLQRLSSGVDANRRANDMAAIIKQTVVALMERRTWAASERKRAAEQRLQREENRKTLVADLQGIRDGRAFGFIRWLVQYTAQYGGNSRYTNVGKDGLAVVRRDFGNDVGEAFELGLRRTWRTVAVPPRPVPQDNTVPWAGLVGVASLNLDVEFGLDVSTLTAGEVTRVFQLVGWSLDSPPIWVANLASARTAEVTSALMPWFEADLREASNEGLARTYRLVAAFPAAVQVPFLRRAQQLLRSGQVASERVQLAVCDASADAGVLTAALMSTLARRHINAAIRNADLSNAEDWLRAWARMDLPGFWRWLGHNIPTSSGPRRAFVASLASALDRAWARNLPANADVVDALTRLYRLLSEVNPDAEGEGGEPNSPISTAPRVRDQIPGILASLPITQAQAALQRLATAEQRDVAKRWLQGVALEHAETTAEREAVLAPADITRMWAVYTNEPRTEAQLCDQVLARLGEIRETLEVGPYSDRKLFRAGMDEKLLQLWLAARLDDTPRRRFTTQFKVAREPEVDLGNRTDIEVASSAGKVCIEIKPVDRKRPYSAKSLTGTLRNQLVGQYLRQRNSRHGVLVLFRLDDKSWVIPGRTKKGGFGDLLEYLRQQAAAIRAQSSHVDRLEVLGIDCVA